MLTPNGVKILDFGISVAAGEPDDDDTGATFGTPAYVAPERLDGMPAEPATDVYGVGVLLFEMVTGDPPYPVETWEELAAARASGPSELPESLPADFRDVVNRCLDADPAKRPTAARLRADLLAVALRSRPPAPDAGEASRARVTSDRPAPEPEPHESGAVAHDDASMWPVGASGSIGNLVRAAGVSADQLGAAGSFGAAAGGNGRAGVAWSVLDPFAEDDPAEVRTTAGRAAGSPRSSFAYDDDDEARDWRPDRGRGAGTGPPDQRRPVGTRNFATGRASAATLDMDESPRRRRLFGVGAAVVLAALVAAFAVLTWTHRDSDRNAALPPAATTPVPPTATATTPAPAATAASPTSAAPSPRTSLTFADAVSRMRDAVNGGVASGQIRKDVAQDLLNLLGPLSDAQGSDLTGQVQALRQKIQTRVGEGGVTEARAAVLQSRLEDLDRAAGI
jgi:eukaryotic-like serine/threonine-protein kinase